MNAPEKLTIRIKLPSASGKLEEFRLSAPRDFGGTGRKAFNRIALAAAHVVADPLALGNPWLDAAVDWDATIAYRRYLWSLGLGVAEAMDTAQRGMGLDWNNSLELIRRSIEASKDIEGAVLFSGAGTDQLAPSAGVTLDDVVAAYEEQCEAIERLGEMFDPQLAGYWGEENHGRAMNTALAVIEANRARVDGIKISLLDRQKEIDMRRRLPAGVRMYTGDDFNY